MITLEIDPAYQHLVNVASLEQTVQLVLEKLSTSDAELTLVIGDNAQIQELNRSYRDVDAPTDVLSFPADFTDPENENPYLGDIIIAYPLAQAQAEQSGHSAQAELQLLTVHGLLHLLGYDHTADAEKAEMWALQHEMLEQLGLGDIQITE